MTYYDNANPTIVDLVDAGARRLCEFGCGAGGLARAIKARLGEVHYVGLEMVPEQLNLARPVLDAALVRNLDQLHDWSSDPELMRALPPASFDHVIFGDVLEHLVDPERTLAQAVKLLVPGGAAVVCMPNVQHWSVFVQLVSGTWPRADSGLFDRTHLRWFTLDDMVRLLTGAGLEVERVEGRVFSPEVGLPFLEDLEPLARSVGVDPDLLIERGLPLQYVLVGRKPRS
jgi:2-polyprenyl-3-methyl-5-hydroxy-6-metoxy-1,4-benzoquinol methylase